MPSIQNARVLFNSVPKGFPVPGETTVYDTTPTIDLDTVSLNGGFLIKTLVLSVDPYFRVAMGGGSHPGFTLGSPIAGFGVAVVVRSETPGVEVGRHVYGHTILHQEYIVVPELGALQLMERHPNLPWSVYLGAAGMPGQTAYMGWKEYSSAKAGEVVFVTAGAGSVGSMVIQLAKKDGLKVITSAGSEEKVKFLRSLGGDVVFNYKTTDTRMILKKEGPIDIYWDNVGGDILEAALENAAVHARFLQCGSISGYNSGQESSKMFHHINGKALHVHGVIMAHLPLMKYLPEFYTTIPPQLASGELKYTEEVTRGLDKVGDVILSVQKGTNTAKGIVLVAYE
ncbi:alcohol dehydrogenase [Mycena metata]|uniref:Alcohol dehydrogenase n=1 Tax=Mycena metata TaxID=1033252 RepID=A0AAD7NG83_9AGAR|nr:alcohol dehydrogenase [Mycena metata]